MSTRRAFGFEPAAVIGAHRRGAEFVAAVERNDRAKAMKVLRRILKDKDGQTAWYLTQWYADDPLALLDLKRRLPRP